MSTMFSRVMTRMASFLSLPFAEFAAWFSRFICHCRESIVYVDNFVSQLINVVSKSRFFALHTIYIPATMSAARSPAENWQIFVQARPFSTCRSPQFHVHTLNSSVHQRGAVQVGCLAPCYRELLGRARNRRERGSALAEHCSLFLHRKRAALGRGIKKLM